jgi:hypothetical protein
MLLGVLGVGLWYSSTPALAVPLHRYLTQLQAANLPIAVAAGASGDVYVAEFDSRTVVEFNPSGEVVRQLTGENIPASAPVGGQFAALRGVAVDSNGDIYVADEGREVVDEFNSEGEFVRQLTGEDVPAGALVHGRFGELQGVATDSSGDVYAFDAGNKVVDEFSSSGVFVQQLAVGEVPVGAPESGPIGEPWAFAVDPANGNVYILDREHEMGRQAVDEFSSSGAFVMQVTGENIPASAVVGGRFREPWGVAVDSSGDVYVVDRKGSALDEFNSSGEFVAQLIGGDVPGSAPVHGTLGEPWGVAVDPGGDVYVTDPMTGHNVVDVFERGVEVAGVTIGATAGLTSSAVTLSGEVNPEGIAVTECQFEYGTGPSYGSSVPCSTGSGNPIGSGDSDVAVQGRLSGLSPGVVYLYRLAATNANGTNLTQGETTLVTAPGVVGSSQASNVTSFAATLTGVLESDEITPAYHFAYGLTSAYGLSTPQPEAIVDAGGQQTVSHTVSGLHPNTTYHFALIASSFSGGESVGPDETFTTRPLVPPAVSTSGVEAIGETSATLTGSVNAEGLPTTYHFEFGPTAGYGSSWPLVQIFAGSGGASQGVAVGVPNLTPGATYHYRLVASNEDGTSYGADEVFTTPGYPVSIVQEAPVSTAKLGFVNPEAGRSPGRASKGKGKGKGKKGKTERGKRGRAKPRKKGKRKG